MKQWQLLQSEFQEYLRTAKSDKIAPFIAGDPLQLETRLNIYNQAYYSRLEKILATHYPVLSRHLGYAPFKQLCHTYLETCPSSHHSIRWFGHHLADFIQESPHYRDKNYLSKLALLEWTLGLVFDAADCPTLTLEDVAALPFEEWLQLTLHLHPSVYCLSLPLKVVKIWQTMMENECPIHISDAQDHVNILLWRKDYSSQIASLSEMEAHAIHALQKGIAFRGICELMCTWVHENEAGPLAAALLKGWIMADLLSCLKTPL